MRRVVVAGVGQTLRRDDGAGPAAVRCWREKFPATAARDEVRVEIEDLPGLALLDTLAGCDAAVVVDAVRSGAGPGTLHVIEENGAEPFGPGAGSAHGWGVAETIALGRRLFPERLPPRLVLIGIEAGSVDPGESLSPAVRQALPEASRLIEQQVARYLEAVEVE